MKSPEQGPNTESGINRELLDLAEQIEKGTKWNRIPTEEASQLLQGFSDKYSLKPSEENPVDQQDALIGLMEQIEDGVKSGQIPAGEAIALFRGLNDKYPVKEDEQS